MLEWETFEFTKCHVKIQDRINFDTLIVRGIQ